MEWKFNSADATAAQAARRAFAASVTDRFGASIDAGAAELILGELIGNVARYAPGYARVRAEFDRGGVTILVADHGSGFRAPAAERDVSALSESGRGLAIVANLASTLEIDCTIGGCTVRARLDAI